MQFAELPLVASPISVVDQQVIGEGIQQCATDLQLSDITLIRQSMNAVYQATSANGPLIMRVSRPTTSTQPAIEFADYLRRQGFEVPAPISQVPFRHDEIIRGIRAAGERQSVSMVSPCLGPIRGTRAKERVLQSEMQTMGLGCASTSNGTRTVRERTRDDQR